MIETVEETGGKYEELRWLTDQYTQYQKHRIAIGNRIFAATEGLDTNTPSTYALRSFERLEELEKDTFQEMKRIVKDHPAWPWLEQVRGIGPTLSTKVLGLIADIEKFDTISKLWMFAGYGLKNGERQKLTKGEKASFNRRLKTALYLVGESFIKSQSPYRELYDNAKHRYHLNKQVQPLRAVIEVNGMPDRTTAEGKKQWDRMIKEANKDAGAVNDEAVWIDGHVHNAARRYMVKIFLSHLYVVWREAEGLSVREPYPIEHLGHTTYLSPWDFVGK